MVIEFKISELGGLKVFFEMTPVIFITREISKLRSVLSSLPGKYKPGENKY